MSNYNHLQGDGLIDWLKNLKNVVLNPVKSLSVIPKEVKDFLEKYGNYKITAMKVCRDPLNSKIIQVADLATKGQFSLNAKQLNYDDIFHLYLKIQIVSPDNQTYNALLERNQRVNISISNKEPSKDGKCLSINLNQYLDLNNFVMKNIDKNIWVYDAFKNNCQDYVINRLSNSGLLSSEVETFVKQDVEQLLPNKLLQNITKGATNVANIFENIWKGGNNKMTMKILRSRAKALKIKNYSKLRKQELINLLHK